MVVNFGAYNFKNNCLHKNKEADKHNKKGMTLFVSVNDKINGDEVKEMADFLGVQLLGSSSLSHYLQLAKKCNYVLSNVSSNNPVKKYSGYHGDYYINKYVDNGKIVSEIMEKDAYEKWVQNMPLRVKAVFSGEPGSNRVISVYPVKSI